MFFLMRYQTVVATSREINLARQFCRVSLVHRMETNVARQPFEVIRLPPAFIPRWYFLSPQIRLCKKTKFLTVRSRVVPYACTPVSYRRVLSYGLGWPRVISTVVLS
jgi:hypothetical protein